MGQKDKQQGETENFTDSILSIICGNDGKSKSMDVKELRKLVLLSHQIDKEDKESKKRFKKTILALQKESRLELSEDGVVKLLKSERQPDPDKKKQKKKRASDEDHVSQEKKKRRRVSNNDDINNSDPSDNEESWKSSSYKGNTITRLFIGNLPFSVDEACLKEFLAPAQLTHIKWITDKETGKFYGSAFVEMKKPQDAVIAVEEKSDQELTGRPIRINYAPAREGDVWPPKNMVETGGDSTSVGRSSQAGGIGLKSMSEKPENCFKLFIGNLSYSIDDESISKFFASVDAEVKTVRWLHHKDSGDFKGCGYVEFWNTEACEKAASLRGKTLLGRPIRIDWAE